MQHEGLPTADDFHMSSAEFREWGHQLIDWIADYRDGIEQYPVLSTVEPGSVRAQLPASPPEHGEGFDSLVADLERVVMPGITHWQAPGFHAYFPANSSGPAILGDLLSSGLGVQGMLWATSPACTEVETHMLDWMIDLCGLPQRFHSSSAGGGVIQDSASSAALSSLLAARTRAGGNEVIDRLVVYTSSQAHSSIAKDSRVAGIRDEHVRSIDVDENLALRVDLLAEAIEADVAAGLIPFFVAATAGTTSTGAFDPVPAIADLCARFPLASGQPIWLHLDAAYAGSAAVCPELRFVQRGVDRVDSYCFNPHKWLLTTFDCSLLFVADRAALIEAMSILPEYLRNAATESGAVIDYRDWHVPLGRRFRALKLWMVIRWYGAEGLRTYIREHVEWAREFAARIEADDRFELMAPAPLSLVCFRLAGDDLDATNTRNEQFIAALNATGRHYLSHTVVNDRYTVRLAIGSISTRPHHVDALWSDIDRLTTEASATS